VSGNCRAGRHRRRSSRPATRFDGSFMGDRLPPRHVRRMLTCRSASSRPQAGRLRRGRRRRAPPARVA
jgi:hypothetical protein